MLAPPSSSPEESHLLTEGVHSLFPIIRVGRLWFRASVTAFYDDHLLIGQCFERRFHPTEQHYLPDGEEDLRGRLTFARQVAYEDIREAREIGHFEGQPASFFGDARNNQIQLVLKSGKTLRTWIHGRQMLHPWNVLIQKLGTRYKRRIFVERTRRQVMAHVFLGFVSLAAGILAAVMLGGSRISNPAFWCMASVIAGLTGTIQAVRSRTNWKEASSVLDRCFYESKRRRSASRNPWRSKLLGWLVKLGGVFYLLVLSVPLHNLFEACFKDALATGTYYQISQYIHALIVLPGVWLIFTGYRLCQKTYSPQTDARGLRKVVFLRPFDDDHSTSLQPEGILSAISGLRHQWPFGNRRASSTGRMRLLDLVANAHPVRLVRMLLNLAVDTSEEVLAHYFSRLGPVIAIGQPGEGLPTPGAARMYLPDDQWQDAVAQELQQAQIVIIQPGATEGVRWELERIRETCEPMRVLFCLVSYWKRPDEYEDLGVLIRGTMGVQLPRSVPYLNRPAFVYFDREWSPILQPLSYHNPIRWPLTGNAPDLDYTLQPFLQGVHGGERELVRPARWVGGFGAGTLHAVALIVAIAVLIAGIFLVESASAGINQWLFPKLAAITPQIPDSQSSPVFEDSRRKLVRGKSVPYLIEVPLNLEPQAIQAPFVEHQFLSKSKLIHLQIAAQTNMDDLSGAAEQLKNVLKNEASLVELVSNQQMTLGGAAWNEIQFKAKTNSGTTLIIIHLAHSSPRGTVLITLAFTPNTNTEPQDLEAARLILHSVRFEK